MKLEEYWRKRKFEKTPEPRGEVKERGLNRFVVQEHHATRLHYDFRLEMDGVLKSWAVPKGVSEEKGVKHLAVAVEDHPVDYIDFEGTIPEGHYGAGTVKIWDSGEYELVKHTPKEIEFVLKGKRLQGRYILLFTGWKGKDNWLIFQVG
jgi:bifunctional non-homologous end joining protein LigD